MRSIAPALVVRLEPLPIQEECEWLTRITLRAILPFSIHGHASPSQVPSIMYTHHEVIIMRDTERMKMEASSPSVMDGKIMYVPSQMDSLASTSTRAVRGNPLRLLIQDAGVLITMLPYLPDLFLPLTASTDSSESYLSLSSAKETILQSLLFIVEVILLILVVPALLILPGAAFILIAILSYTAIYLIARPMEGPPISYSKMDEATMALAAQHNDERWLFVNGTATGHAGLQKNIDRVSKTFGRAVIGIHNKSYGLIADLLECVIQRCLAFNSMDVRTTYFSVKPLLTDPTVTKVVLIGHSQGGIIISLVLDHLFAEMPAKNISKLEVYTFGSAASHFSNPLLSLKSTDLHSTIPKPPSAPAQPQHIIKHIEHYANEYDMIPRWGVLHSVRTILSNRYAGSVFVRMGASGHMFNQHYMDPMFPLSKPESLSPLEAFLDSIVSMDGDLTFARREAGVSDVDVLCKDAGLEFGNGQIIPDDSPLTNGTGSGKGGNAVMVFSRTSSGLVVGEEAPGKTVRALSRLWRYRGGRSPEPDLPGAVVKEGE